MNESMVEKDEDKPAEPRVVFALNHYTPGTLAAVVSAVLERQRLASLKEGE